MRNTLEQRLSLLEKRIRTYQLAFAGFIVVSIVIITMAFKNKNAYPDVVQAKSFQVVDDNGHVAVELNMDDGDGKITTYNAAGGKLIRLYSTVDRAGSIDAYDGKGNLNFSVANTSGGGGYVAVYNDKAKEVAEMGITDNSSGYFRINDKEGNKQAYLTYTIGGGGYLSLSNNGVESIRLSTEQNGGRVGVYNNNNNRVAYMGAEDNGNGNIVTWNSAGTWTGAIPH